MYFRNFILLVLANASCITILILSRYSETINSSQDDALDVVVESSSEYLMETINGMERVMTVEKLEPYYCIEVSKSDIEVLMKIVEAEAGSEDLNGKLLVADVVINRVKSDAFPNNVTDVIYQKSQNITQFSPVSNGRINKVTISNDTKTAVYNALRGEDISNGALYFMARKFSEPMSVLWFDKNLTFLFTYGNHDFFS
jgi:N-acetylmuramoyl-L-alanine amidase